MDTRYCDIFGDCFHCPLAVCPLAEQVEAWKKQEKGKEEG